MESTQGLINPFPTFLYKVNIILYSWIEAHIPFKYWIITTQMSTSCLQPTTTVSPRHLLFWSVRVMLTEDMASYPHWFRTCISYSQYYKVCWMECQTLLKQTIACRAWQLTSKQTPSSIHSIFCNLDLIYWARSWFDPNLDNSKSIQLFTVKQQLW